MVDEMTEHTPNLTPARGLTVKRNQKQQRQKNWPGQKNNCNDTVQRQESVASNTGQLCHANKGVHVKVGQHIANLDFLGDPDASIVVSCVIVLIEAMQSHPLVAWRF